MNKTMIESALGAGLGALTLLKILREVDVSKKPWKSEEQKARWMNAKNKLNTSSLNNFKKSLSLDKDTIKNQRADYKASKKANEIKRRLFNK